MGVKKVNTTAYHPQTDGLVEHFNRTLIDMLAKTTKAGVEWDERIPYVLFAYRASVQASTGETPFFLLYVRDPPLATELVLPSVRRAVRQLQVKDDANHEWSMGSCQGYTQEFSEETEETSR